MVNFFHAGFFRVVKGSRLFSTPEWGCEVPMRPIRTPSTLRSLYTLLKSIVAAAGVLIYPK